MDDDLANAAEHYEAGHLDIRPAGLQHRSGSHVHDRRHVYHRQSRQQHGSSLVGNRCKSEHSDPASEPVGLLRQHHSKRVRQSVHRHRQWRYAGRSPVRHRQHLRDVPERDLRRTPEQRHLDPVEPDRFGGGLQRLLSLEPVFHGRRGTGGLPVGGRYPARLQSQRCRRNFDRVPVQSLRSQGLRRGVLLESGNQQRDEAHCAEHDPVFG